MKRDNGAIWITVDTSGMNLKVSQNYKDVVNIECGAYLR
jgi:hypothetical protein